MRVRAIHAAWTWLIAEEHDGPLDGSLAKLVRRMEADAAEGRFDPRFVLDVVAAIQDPPLTRRIVAGHILRLHGLALVMRHDAAPALER